jgi:hypothetical protein
MGKQTARQDALGPSSIILRGTVNCRFGISSIERLTQMVLHGTKGIEGYGAERKKKGKAEQRCCFVSSDCSYLLT